MATQSDVDSTTAKETIPPTTPRFSDLQRLITEQALDHAVTPRGSGVTVIKRKPMEFAK